LQNHANFYTFRHIPWALWMPGFILVGIVLFISYFLYFEMKTEERSYFLVLFNIFLLYLSAFIFYAGKVEVVTIDKKVY
jgi:hypothetical protein